MILLDALEFFLNDLKPVTTGTGSHNSVTGTANFEDGLVLISLLVHGTMKGYTKMLALTMVLHKCLQLTVNLCKHLQVR